MTEDTSSGSRDGVLGSNYGRRRFIAVGSGVGAALIAGCTSSDGGNGNGGGNGGGSGGGGTASFRLLVSDAPADIGDFDRLDVTFSKARVFEGGDGEGTETEGTDAEGTENGTENETSGEMTETVEEDEQTNETDAENGTATETENGTETETEESTENGTETDAEEDGEGDGEDGKGFYVLELDSPTVDLTQVVGDKAVPIFEGELEEGSYQKLELHVESTEGIVDGETVDVKVPSNKLQLTKPFEVKAGEELDFVFDINVVKRGNQASYILKPVISQSGVRGKDVEVEEVGEDGEGSGSEEGDESNASDDDGGAGDADNETDDESGGPGGAGNETGGNESAA